jgi:hypothetical protein
MIKNIENEVQQIKLRWGMNAFEFKKAPDIDKILDKVYVKKIYTSHLSKLYRPKPKEHALLWVSDSGEYASIIGFPEFLFPLLSDGMEYLQSIATLVDKKMAQLVAAIDVYQQGSMGVTKVYDDIGKLLLKLSIPSKFKKVSAEFLYRGLRLKEDSMARVNKEDTLILKKRVIASFTTSLDEAASFIERRVAGVILKYPSKDLNVLINLSSPGLLPYLVGHEEQDEVIVVSPPTEVSADNYMKK